MAAKSKSRWSGQVTQHSDALNLEKDIFKSGSPDAIAKSLNLDPAVGAGLGGWNCSGAQPARAAQAGARRGGGSSRRPFR